MTSLQQLIKAGLSESSAQAVIDSETILVTGVKTAVDTAIVAETGPLGGTIIVPIVNRFIDAGVDNAPSFFSKLYHRIKGD